MTFDLVTFFLAKIDFFLLWIYYRPCGIVWVFFSAHTSIPNVRQGQGRHIFFFTYFFIKWVLTAIPWKIAQSPSLPLYLLARLQTPVNKPRSLRSTAIGKPPFFLGLLDLIFFEASWQMLWKLKKKKNFSLFYKVFGKSVNSDKPF